MYKKGEVIDNNDIGKELAYNDPEIANYNFFAITIRTTLNSSNRYFTFLFLRTSSNLFKYFSAIAVPAYTSGGTSAPSSYLFQVTLSNNIFSVSGTCNNSATSCSFQQIRGLF